MTRDEIVRITGASDDARLARIEALQPSQGELLEAMQWLSNDEALIAEDRPMPAGRVAQLVDLLEEPEVDLGEPDY